MSTAEQGSIFLTMLLVGAGCCIACGAAALLLRALHAGALLRGLADVLYGAVFAGGVVVSSLALRIQAVRWYVFAGVLAGVVLVYGTYAALYAGANRLWAFWHGKAAKKEK